MEALQFGERRTRSLFRYNLITKFKHDADSVMVWGCLSASGVGTTFHSWNYGNKGRYKYFKEECEVKCRKNGHF